MVSDPSHDGEYVLFECALHDSGALSPGEAEALAFSLLGAASKARAERRCKELRDDAEDCETVGATAGRP
jgi:hypothetical protein